MNDLRAAAQQALEALEWMGDCYVGDDDDAGECASCHERSYEPHAPDCKKNNAITNLRAALAQQDEPLNLRDPAVQKRLATQWGYVPAAQAEPVEPVVRECSDPMCACRGGPCAECEEGEREKEIEDLRSSLYFYQRRCEALQSWQSKMRDPERTIVCDILANGKTLDPAFAGDRYTAPPQQAEPEPVAWSFEARHIDTAWGLAVSLKHPGQEHKYLRNVKPLYTAPPQRKLVPLTEEEIKTAFHAARNAKLGASQDNSRHRLSVIEIARAIEKASWEKNNGQA